MGDSSGDEIIIIIQFFFLFFPFLCPISSM